MAIITSRRTKRANAQNFQMALSPLVDTTKMPATVPGDVNSPVSSQDNAPVSRPEVCPTAVESTPKPVLRQSFSEMAPSPVPGTTEMSTIVPGDVNPPVSSHNNAPVSRPEVFPTTVESAPKPVLRRSFSEMAPSPLPDTSEMQTTIPGDINPPVSSHDNAPVSRPVVAPTAVESTPKPVLKRSFSEMAPSPLPDTTEMPNTIPGDVNPPGSSQDNAPVSRPQVAPATAGSPLKQVLRRSQRQRRPPKHLSDFVLTKA